MDDIRILHVFPSFDVGGSEMRFVTLANSLPDRFRHSVLAMDGRYGAAGRLRNSGKVQVPAFNFSRSGTVPNIVAAHRALRTMRPDLLATYNWGAIEWAFAASFTSVPYLHIVDGFGPEESHRQLARRVWFRRAALARCSMTVVPSRTLHELVRTVWRLPAGRVEYIPNGIDVEKFAALPDEALIADLGIRRDRPIVGTVANLRREKNIPRLLRAFATVNDKAPATLVVVGDGPERAGLESLARSAGVADAVRFTGGIDNPGRVLAIFDVFAVSSDTEQMPFSVMEAMAAGLPIASVDVGDVRAMVSEANGPYVVDRDHEKLAAAICKLLGDEGARRRIGADNRAHARREFALDRMVSAYGTLFALAAGQRSPG